MNRTIQIQGRLPNATLPGDFRPEATTTVSVGALPSNELAEPFIITYNGQPVGVAGLPNGPRTATRSGGVLSPQTDPAALAPVSARDASGDGGVDPYAVALYLRDHVPLPNVQVRANPGLGMVAVPGWFWVEGYDGGAFGASRTVNIPPDVGPEVPVTVVSANDPRRQGTSFTVSVNLRTTSYGWTFGDGAALVTTSLGKPYPRASDIRHTYGQSSLRFPRGFPVEVATTFAAAYRVDGGPERGLQPITHVYSASYPVQESQSILMRLAAR